MTVFLFFIGVAAVYLSFRYVVKIHLGKNYCPSCRKSIKRVKRLPKDYFLSTVLYLPLGRYQCINYSCRWQGIKVGNLGSLSKRTVAHSKSNFTPGYTSNPCPDNLLHHLSNDPLFQSKSDSKSDVFLGSTQSVLTALDNEDFILYFQPQVNLITKNITGVEVLLRCYHPERGLINPNQFLSNLEFGDRIVLVEKWIIKRSFYQLKIWNELGINPLQIGINISNKHFYRPDLISNICTLLEKIGLDGSSVEIEVSEKTVADNLEAAIEIIRRLKYAGIRVALNDFGSGYISLQQIKLLPISTLKIDRSLVVGVGCDPKDTIFFESLLKLAESLDVEIIAQGIETLEQLNCLRSLGCKTVQGFLYDYPLCSEDVTDVLQSNWLGQTKLISSIPTR
ncbi:MAG TPA: EAL domain-containing protein [Stenomitos sp.]